jgi:hypothetical protein
MWKKLTTYCATLSFWRVFSIGLVLAIVFELFTIAGRYGFGLQTTRDTTVIAPFTFGLRVHHGYIGVFLLLLGWCFPRGLRHLLWIVAFGLILSDLGHHFIVLWIIEGSPQFDLVYPTRP